MFLGYGRTQAGVLVNTIISREFFITCLDVDVYRERRSVLELTTQFPQKTFDAPNAFGKIILPNPSGEEIMNIKQLMCGKSVPKCSLVITADVLTV